MFRVGPRPNRGGRKLLKVISRVIKKCKADKPKSAGNGDGKDDEVRNARLPVYIVSYIASYRVAPSFREW